MKVNRTWGGSWTEQKLDAFEKYVKAYLTIMNRYRDKYNWKLIYFDAFAGSGNRDIGQNEQEQNRLLSDIEVEPAELSVYKGAAERFLSIKHRGFNFYYFIEVDEASKNELENKLASYKSVDKKLEFRSVDANEQILLLANAMHINNNLTTLLLLDPFGMQVNWASIEHLKDTRTDLWILIPTGVIVNRLLDRKGELIHIEKLESFFGLPEAEIRKYFYNEKIENTLFGDMTLMEKIKNPIKNIASLYIKQLKTIFHEVIDEPLEMRNSRNVPIFHFTFASNNKTATKIAGQIIGKI